jgi:hypothetical protein
MLPTFKVEVKSGKVRRAAGRPKGIIEKVPRMAKGSKAVQRAQAQAQRLAALKRRQVLDALGDATLPYGSSVNDLTPLQATEIAMQNQGMTSQAAQLAAQEAAVQEIAAARAEALNHANAAQIDARAVAAELHKLRKADPTAALARNIAAAAASMAPTKLSVATSLSAAANALSPAKAASPLPPTPPKRSLRVRKGTAKTMGGDGLDPLRIAMDHADNGNREEALRMLKTFQRNRLDPLTKARDYIMAL